MSKASKSLKSIALTVVFILFSFLPSWPFLGDSQWAIAAPAPSAQVGTIPGEFAVNGNGGATYTVPIEVPPGINGVQPNLSLVYNSQQGNGLLGVGWQLAGLSAIARCGKTIATDGARGGVNFDSGDRFCFDGQRLMAVSGNYGANGTEYRTERETWVRVISHTESGKNGPRSFTVTTKDGHQMEFGNTDDSRILARGRSDGAVRVWALNKISDRNGNFVEVSYQEDVSRAKRSISGAFLGYYPTAVRYTGNSGVTPLRLVKFEYENRNDNITAYVGGSEAETTKRLAQIKTYVDLDGDGNSIETANNLVKEYRLAYEYGTATGRSRLTQLEECDAAGVCLPQTQFEWKERDIRFAAIKLGFDANRDYRNLLVADVNGDGLSDLIYQAGTDGGSCGNGQVGLYVSNGSGFNDLQCLGFDANRDYRNLIPADVNGDGLSDLIYQAGTDGGSCGNGQVGLYVSNGSGFNDLQCLGFDANRDYRNLIPADVNGDGLSDLIYQAGTDGGSCGNGQVGLYVSNGSGFNDLQCLGFDANRDYRNLIPADVNGDGLSDLIYQAGTDGGSCGNGQVGLYVSNGSGFNDLQCLGFDANRDYRNLIPADVNGDGLSDLIYQAGTDGGNFGAGQAGLYLNTSDIPDLIPDLLTTITNGLGGQTKIEYKPLTDSTVYTKEVTETENNGTANSANGLGSTDVVVRGNISSSSDEDWFAFDIPSSREITISVAIDNNQDLDWYLY
ncbi:MAG: VCBS repeat-containing protein [Hormoscilla sp. GUM202]|nr:VCBS repeat-containing protein [Hormoscilla sp. GUM202]